MFFENSIDLYEVVMNDLLREKSERDETENKVDNSTK